MRAIIRVSDKCSLGKQEIKFESITRHRITQIFKNIYLGWHKANLLNKIRQSLNNSTYIPQPTSNIINVKDKKLDTSNPLKENPIYLVMIVNKRNMIHNFQRVIGNEPNNTTHIKGIKKAFIQQKKTIMQSFSNCFAY